MYLSIPPEHVTNNKQKNKALFSFSKNKEDAVYDSV